MPLLYNLKPLSNVSLSSPEKDGNKNPSIFSCNYTDIYFQSKCSLKYDGFMHKMLTSKKNFIFFGEHQVHDENLIILEDSFLLKTVFNFSQDKE